MNNNSGTGYSILKPVEPVPKILDPVGPGSGPTKLDRVPGLLSPTPRPDPQPSSLQLKKIQIGNSQILRNLHEVY